MAKGMQGVDMATLKTERLVMRPPQESDVDDIVAGWQDPEVRRWTAVPYPGSREQASHFVHQTCQEGWRAGTNYIFAVVLRSSAEFVGLSGVFGITWASRAERLASMGCWTAEKQRGLGYTAEAVRAIANWAFSALELDRLEWIGEVGNEGSLACAAKAGFRYEGTMRSRVIQDGTRRDAWMASLLPQDIGLEPSLPYQAPGGGTAPLVP